MRKTYVVIITIISIIAIIISTLWILFVTIGSIGCILDYETYHWGGFEYAFSFISLCLGCGALWYGLKLHKMCKQARIIANVCSYPDNDKQVMMQMLHCDEVHLPILLHKLISYHVFTDAFISLHLLPILHAKYDTYDDKSTRYTHL